MSVGSRLNESYQTVLASFGDFSLSYPTGGYPKIDFGSQKALNQCSILIGSCTSLYNEIDSAVEILKKTVPDVYKNFQDLIENKIIGGLASEDEVCSFIEGGTYTKGSIHRPSLVDMPFGIMSVSDLLTKAMEFRIMRRTVKSDECFYTAWLTFRFLEAALKQFTTRLNYVMLYPHRIVLDRVIMETILKKNGMDKVVAYVSSAEEHFNNKKYVDFCAMSRNALEETVRTICLLLGGSDHGYALNLKHLEDIGFIRSTIFKQTKEFGGTLSSCGSHPPSKGTSDIEAKFLLDSLYGILGFLVMRYSSFEATKKVQKY